MERISQMEALFKAYAQPAAPGAAVMVIHHGKPVFVRTFGLANLAENMPVRPATNFRLASVTKQFTAMSIMMLVERGKLDYERTLAGLFPDFPVYGRAVTIRHLLQHTSGLLDYEDLLPDTATAQVLDRDVLALMQAQDSTYFPPGTQYRYSNSGYAVLAMVVERVTGMRFAEFLRANIFAPLGMNNTVAFENGVSSVKHRALGYREENGAFVLKDQSLTSAVLGDGGIYSSIEDLFKWDQALYTERLVSAATLQQAFTPGVLADGRPLDYGLGWRLQEYRGHRRVQHTGSTSGFRNVIQRYPDDKFSVIILTNRAEPEVEELATQLTDIFLFGK